MDTQHQLYHHMLQDLISATKQAVDAFESLAAVATAPRLRELIETRRRAYAADNDALIAIASDHKIDPHGEHCHGMEGLVKEARKHAVDMSAPDDVVDASVLAQFMRLASYRLAGYRAAAMLAENIDVTEDLKMLREHLVSAERSWDLATELGERRIMGAAV